MRQTRPHGDLDVVIDRDDVPHAQAALAEIGFAHAPHILPGEVDGTRVACVSAELQLRHHLGYPWDDP